MKLKKIRLPFRLKKSVLALGPQAKNTVCFGEGNLAYISPVHPDLSSPQDFLSFQKIVKYFLKKRPWIIAYDLHPGYQSSRYALSLAARYSLLPVQHHHAHIASCMAQNRLGNKKVIGVAFDGTGLGSEGNLWGAEFLVCDYKEFKRAAHLKEIPLLGGEKAISEPARIAAYWLYLIYKDKFLDLGLALTSKMNKKWWGVLKNMHSSGVNSPLTSSMGRLFDAVASLVLGKDRADTEAELAIELEKLSALYSAPSLPYGFKILKNKSGYIIDPLPMFKGIAADLKAKEPKTKIAYRFHFTVAQMIKKAGLILRRETGINNIALSGGVFQNNLLLCLASDLLYKEGFKVFTHTNAACNDSGISLGQMVIAGLGS